MIQVRCPECGYLQTLSEERFLAISEDFLNCPHCHARIEKKWSPAHPDNMPEETKHKIIAFSRRILNGGAINRAVVSALEALVRRYGQMESSLKALGIGYGSLGENKKAEEFLSLALQESPEDVEILRWLAKTQLALEKHVEAYTTVTRVMEMVGENLLDEDVATVALSLIGLGRIEEARNIMDAHPDLDASDRMVKQALKKLGRGSGKNIAKWSAAFSLFNKLVSSSNKFGLQRLRDRATNIMKSRKFFSQSDEASIPRKISSGSEHAPFIRNPHQNTAPRKLGLEYWIYSPNEDVPDWEKIKKNLNALCNQKSGMKTYFAQVDHLIQANALTIEYVKKEEAEDLFSYPEDLLPRNSRGLNPQDIERVINARLIVRIRFFQKVDNPGGWLQFVAYLVDSFRSDTSGTVQDVISHTLWGEGEWKKNIKGGFGRRLDFHLNCEAVEEPNGLWIHTHGMQKFGFPELELEAVPDDLAAQASKLMIMVAQTLLNIGPMQGGHTGPISIQSTPYSFTITMRSPDDEAHFPAGSAVVNAFLTGNNPTAAEAVREVLTKIGATKDADSLFDRDLCHHQNELDAILRRNILSAHEKARQKLSHFKRSFRTVGMKEDYVHAIKVRFDSESGDHEWMWVSLDTWKGRSIEGVLENNPVLMKELSRGSRINVSDQDIFDWVIMTEGQILDGGFTETLKPDMEQYNN